jgi:hypothetical protein
MVVFDRLSEIVDQYEIGKLSEVGISPYSWSEFTDRAGKIGTWMTRKTNEEIATADKDKIIIAFKIENTCNKNYIDLVTAIFNSGLLNEYYFVSFHKDDEPTSRYLVLLQLIQGKCTLAKKFPLIDKTISFDIKNVDSELFTDVPAYIEMHHKISYFDSPLIFE